MNLAYRGFSLRAQKLTASATPRLANTTANVSRVTAE